MKKNEPEHERTPDSEHLFWLYDPEGNGMMYFRTAEERDEMAALVIPHYCDDVWSEEVENVCAGTVTHIATMVNKQERPPEEELNEDGDDEEGRYWPMEWAYTCNYELKAVET